MSLRWVIVLGKCHDGFVFGTKTTFHRFTGQQETDETLGDLLRLNLQNIGDKAPDATHSTSNLLTHDLDSVRACRGWHVQPKRLRVKTCVQIKYYFTKGTRRCA